MNLGEASGGGSGPDARAPEREIPHDLRRAYEAAWIEVEIGGRFVFPPVSRGAPPALPSELRPGGFVITACNPRSVRLPEAENRARQDELAAELDRRRLRRIAAIGHDGGEWREPSFAVVGAPREEVLELARRFSQNAVYEFGDGIWRVIAVTDGPGAAAGDPAADPARPGRDRAMRLAVCSWSLGASDPRDLVEQVRRSGLFAVQLALGAVLDEWGIDETRRTLAEGGVRAVSGMMKMAGEDYSTLATIRATGGLLPDETWPANRAAAAETARAARELALPLVTFHAGFIPEDAADPRRARLIERLREVADIFSESGVRIALETGQETAATLLGALRELDRPDVGINFDPANLILYGMGDPIDALRRLAPRIAQVHVKDARPAAARGEWGTEVVAGSGAVDWHRFLGIVSALDPAVDLVIEREAGPDRVIDVRTAVALVRQTLAELGQGLES